MSHEELATSPGRGAGLGVGQSNPRFSRGDEGQENISQSVGKGAAAAWAWLVGGCFPKPPLHRPVNQTESNCFQHSLWGEAVVWIRGCLEVRPQYYGAGRILATDPPWSHSSGLSYPLCYSIPEPNSVRAQCLLFDKWWSAKNHLVILILTALFPSGALEVCSLFQETPDQVVDVGYAMQWSSTHTKPTWQLVLGFHGRITAQMPKRRGEKKKSI